MAKRKPTRVVAQVWAPAWEIVCEYCGQTAVVRRKDARFCKPSHRVMAHRKAKLKAGCTERAPAEARGAKRVKSQG